MSRFAHHLNTMTMGFWSFLRSMIVYDFLFGHRHDHNDNCSSPNIWHNSHNDYLSDDNYTGGYHHDDYSQGYSGYSHHDDVNDFLDDLDDF
ncbi:MAG: hypothetical protein NC111_01720 [Bacteroides sp.]|nr:hypothetical protein [Bacteroides sp.]MCM1413822.1 hypothetical protein [Bacteroides sp.]MCM1471234.1 hypothetical protein [Bacteroides sp.]